MRPFVAAVSCPARSHNTWTITPLLPRIKRRLIPPLTPSCRRYYIVHPSCAKKTRRERNTNEEQTVNSYDASEGAKRGRGSPRRLDLALIAQSLSCWREGRGVMNGLYHTRRPTTAQTNYLTDGFCIGGWPQECACPVLSVSHSHGSRCPQSSHSQVKGNDVVSCFPCYSGRGGGFHKSLPRWMRQHPTFFFLLSFHTRKRLRNRSISHRCKRQIIKAFLCFTEPIFGEK